MLTPDRYAALHDALVQRGVRLINDPRQYQYAHFLPENYPDLIGFTPESICIPIGELEWAQLAGHLKPFGDRPLVVKDWVESRKHEWKEACFIPSAGDGATVERVARRFVELQGDDLTAGLVFRAFEQFEPLSRHPQSGMPLTKEFRIFFVDGSPLFSARYWPGEDYGALQAPIDEFAAVAARVRSRFCTMDVARRTDGAWRIVEIGDGQVSALPEDANPTQFYRALRRALGQ